jgi:2',3'-cyclic-nucleotide 2'-phosphodiesterase (5'-nucleotidase family)
MTGQHRNIILLVMALGVLSVALTLLAGCAPQHPATALPPATVLAPDLSPSMPTPVSPTAQPAAPSTDTPVPQVSATSTPSVSPTVMAATGPTINITILHTNDVMGEIDPCG